MAKQPEASYDLPLLNAIDKPTREQERAAALTCAHHARTTDELVDLLEMIGVRDYDPGPKPRTRHK
jgi:hypothetical protein